MDLRYELYIFPKAQEDFNKIFDYISQILCAPIAADNLAKKIDEALDTVCEFPFSCPIADNIYFTDRSLRKLIVNKYIIYYFIDKKKKRVEVMRIIYGMRDLRNILIE
jgi:Plasmid stabilization system protein